MANPTVRLRDFSRAMLDAGCRMRPGKGSHCVWFCPCGIHMITVARHAIVAPNVLRDVVNRMICIEIGF